MPSVSTRTEQNKKMEVQIISSETIKPETPTPSHLTNFTLSLLDHGEPPSVVPTLLFYSAPLGAPPLDITRLKSCLSQTLSSFYPLAGRFQTWGTTLCNDEGVPFVVARVNCPLSTLIASLSSSSDVDLGGFYPPKKSLIKSGVHVSIQINVFTCGGFALGWYHTHKMTDATSAATFLRNWAALVNQRYENAAQDVPDFTSGPAAFPCVPGQDFPVESADVDQQKEASKSFLPDKNIVVRSFVFNNSAVAKLKAASASEKLANPSRFMAVAAFVWQQILLASPQSNKVGKSLAYLPVDIRSRCDPVLPKVSIGNFIQMALVCVDKRAPLPELVAEIHGSISSIKDIVVEYQGEKRSEAKEKQFQKFVRTAFEYEWKDLYILTPWCKSAGFSDVDFGFGKPDWIVPIDDRLDHGKRDSVTLMEFRDEDGDGFEAWLFLEDKHVEVLESNPDFLAFASPRF